MYVQEYRGGVSLEMDDQVIRVKRANDCPALLKSFRWRTAGWRERDGERDGGSQHGEQTRYLLWHHFLAYSYFSLHSYLEATAGIQLLSSLRRNSQIHSRPRHSRGCARGFIQDLTISSSSTLFLLARQNESSSCRERKKGYFSESILLQKSNI